MLFYVKQLLTNEKNRADSINDKEQLYSCEPWPGSTHKIGKYTLFYSYSGGGLQWFAVVCGGLRWFACFSSFSQPIVPNYGGGLWWLEVVCGGLWWFVVVCGGLRWFVMVCGGLSYSHTLL